jgi:hypothetical protein
VAAIKRIGPAIDEMGTQDVVEGGRLRDRDGAAIEPRELREQRRSAARDMENEDRDRMPGPAPTPTPARRAALP